MSRTSMRVMVIIASTRPTRLGPAIADWFVRTVETDTTERGIEVDLADLAEIGLPLLDEPEHPSTGAYIREHTRAWSARVAAADAFAVVTPEYNYSMPAALKNALDFLYHEWAWKPVGFLSYGNTSAGTRGVQMSKQVVTTLRMVPIAATVALRISEVITDGQVDSSPELDQAAGKLLSELTRTAEALRPLRIPPTVAIPAGETPIPGLELAPLTASDVPELLVLQRCCWVSEALANDSLKIAALHETLEDVHDWTARWQVWSARQDGRLIGAVRARRSGDAWEIGRLMVAPDLAGRGIGRWLLAHAERQAPQGISEFTLVTGARSHRNRRLYDNAGYATSKDPSEASSPPIDTVHLTKSA